MRPWQPEPIVITTQVRRRIRRFLLTAYSLASALFVVALLWAAATFAGFGSENAVYHSLALIISLAGSVISIVCLVRAVTAKDEKVDSWIIHGAPMLWPRWPWLKPVPPDATDPEPDAPLEQ
jgi:hypothetical protein